MLVLTRKENECIIINSTIEVRVLKTHGNRVTIGLSVPKEIPVRRGELQPRLETTNEEYSHASRN
jgi:carbon storage regulator CsrA